MAIWQESIIVIPNEAVKLEKPLKINDKEEYEKLWKNRNTKSEDIISEIDSFIGRAHWVNSEHWIYWKGDEKNFQDNDISLTFDKETKIISFLTFRFDMRAKSLDFMNRMIKISKENNWLFQTYNNEIFEPNLEKIPQLVANSDLKKLIDNPDKFVEELKEKPWNAHLKEKSKEQKKKSFSQTIGNKKVQKVSLIQRLKNWFKNQ